MDSSHLKNEPHKIWKTKRKMFFYIIEVVRAGFSGLVVDVQVCLVYSFRCCLEGFEFFCWMRVLSAVKAEKWSVSQAEI